MSSVVVSPHYILNIYCVNESYELEKNSFSGHFTGLVNMYKNNITKHNNMCMNAVNHNITFDAGFDLFAPVSKTAHSRTTLSINHCIRSSMEFFDGISKRPCGYYLYPRSSTGAKTPLRLANSVGIIDSGYRGDIIAVFDNISEQDFNIQEKQRLVQICPPNLTYPMFVNYVDDMSLLGTTARGTGGFGSTGN
jgi:dUTP pyrophosphatase